MKILTLVLSSLIYLVFSTTFASETQEPKSSFILAVYASPWSAIPNGQVRWLAISDQNSNLDLITKSGEPVNFGLEVKLDPEWHTYWQNPGDSGAPPEIYLKTKGSEDQKLKIHYPYPERIEVGPLITYGYSDQLIYFFKTLKKDFSLRADLLVCKEECIPGSSTYNSTDKMSLLTNSFRTSSDSDAYLESFVASEFTKLPESMTGQYVQGLSQVEWNFALPEKSKIVDFFWSSESVNDLSLPKFIKSDSEYKFFLSPQDMGPSAKKSALVVYEINSSDKEAKPKIFSRMIEFQEGQPAMLWFFLMAFLGGVILNLMPCVFPIVSIKAFSVLKTSGLALQNIRKQNLAYSSGVVFCFVLLGLLLSVLRSSGTYLGWGFQLQNPYVVLSLAFIFFILALSFFDLWSWNFIPGFATKYYAEDSLWSSFLTGLLAVIVASPCTAPFMGAAIGFAITQSTLAILIVFFGLGLGMSLPFLLMALFPQVSKFLPRPGPWMIYFKKIMGVMLLATVVWLVWVFIQLIQPSTAKDLDIWNGLNVDEWSAVSEDLDSARFVNFTADWCVTCKVNERLVFGQDNVQNFVNENQIKIYKVDWTKREDKIARKLAEFGRIGVPLYLYFPKGSRSPVVLSELLTPQGFISNLKDQDSNIDSK